MEEKRLYRDTDDKMIAGVASGIAKYVDVDPSIIRSLFVMLLFIANFNVVIAYILLAIIIPSKKDILKLKKKQRKDKEDLNDYDFDDF